MHIVLITGLSLSAAIALVGIVRGMIRRQPHQAPAEMIGYHEVDVATWAREWAVILSGVDLHVNDISNVYVLSPHEVQCIWQKAHEELGLDACLLEHDREMFLGNLVKIIERNLRAKRRASHQAA